MSEFGGNNVCKINGAQLYGANYNFWSTMLAPTFDIIGLEMSNFPVSTVL